jgi:uncharacterized membrane protein
MFISTAAGRHALFLCCFLGWVSATLPAVAQTTARAAIEKDNKDIPQITVLTRDALGLRGRGRTFLMGDSAESLAEVVGATAMPNPDDASQIFFARGEEVLLLAIVKDRKVQMVMLSESFAANVVTDLGISYQSSRKEVQRACGDPTEQKPANEKEGVTFVYMRTGAGVLYTFAKHKDRVSSIVLASGAALTGNDQQGAVPAPAPAAEPATPARKPAMEEKASNEKPRVPDAARNSRFGLSDLEGTWISEKHEHIVSTMTIDAEGHFWERIDHDSDPNAGGEFAGAFTRAGRLILDEPVADSSERKLTVKTLKSDPPSDGEQTTLVALDNADTFRFVSDDDHKTFMTFHRKVEPRPRLTPGEASGKYLRVQSLERLGDADHIMTFDLVDVVTGGRTIGSGKKVVMQQELGGRAVWWEPDSTKPTELPVPSADAIGVAYTAAHAVGRDGTIVGVARKADGDDFSHLLAATWDKSGKLQLLPDPQIGFEIMGTVANDVNDDGLVVGSTEIINDGKTPLEGTHGVCWRDGKIQILKSLGVRKENSFEYEANAIAVNNAGDIVGYAKRFVDGGDAGQRAVRWDELGNVTELQPFDEDPAGVAHARAVFVNERGTAFGSASKYNASIPPTYLYYHNDLFPCLWKKGSTVPVAMQVLGVDDMGKPGFGVTAVSDDDIAVGFCDEYNADHKLMGQHAVQWDGNGRLKRFRELANNSSSSAHDINMHGVVVGSCSVDRDYRAVYLTSDGMIVDLNTLIDPESGWKLSSAEEVSDDGWIIGNARWNPKGGGEADTVMCIYRLHVPALASH